MSTYDLDQWESYIHTAAVKRAGYGRGSLGLDVDDLKQVGRLAAIKAMETWNPNGGSALKTWVLAAIPRAMIDEQRNMGSRKRQKWGVNEYEYEVYQMEHFNSIEPTCYLDYEDDWRMDWTDRLSRLRGKQAKVIRMRYFGGMKFVRIAEVLKLTPARVMQIHRAALDALRRYAVNRGA